MSYSISIVAQNKKLKDEMLEFLGSEFTHYHDFGLYQDLITEALAEPKVGEKVVLQEEDGSYRGAALLVEYK